MRFYSIDYLQTQSSINDYLKYIVIFSNFIYPDRCFSLYMRHRLQTKYRDLTIIAFLFLLFISGVQYADYTDSKIYIPNHHKWLILSGPYHKKMWM